MVVAPQRYRAWRCRIYWLETAAVFGGNALIEMLPALVRRCTDLPPPFRSPTRIPSCFRSIVTGRSVCTPPIDVLASILNPPEDGIARLMAPAFVSRLTSLGFVTVAAIAPPAVRAFSGPLMSWKSRRPPLLVVSTEPAKFRIETAPPLVLAFNEPLPPNDSILPPFVCTFTEPSQSANFTCPPLVRASIG